MLEAGAGTGMPGSGAGTGIPASGAGTGIPETEVGEPFKAAGSVAVAGRKPAYFPIAIPVSARSLG